MAGRCVTWMLQFVCALHGHDELLQFGTGRLSLKCASCGHESPGWDIKRRHEEPMSEPAAHDQVRWRRLLPHFASARRLA